MAKSNKVVKTVKSTAKLASSAIGLVNVAAAPATPAEVKAEPVVVAKVRSAVKRLPFEAARAHNRANVVVDPKDVKPADVAFTEKGTNKSKRRVYGYDNWANGNGKVPVGSKVVIVPEAKLPKAVGTEQWELLVKLVTSGTALVTALYDAGIHSRTIRRSYRAGAIRFVA